MRSRYSAYATQNKEYLLATWHPATCPNSLELEDRQRWIGLKVLNMHTKGADSTSGEVEFVARYKIDGRGYRLHETSHFERIEGRWLYVGGVVSGSE